MNTVPNLSSLGLPIGLLLVALAAAGCSTGEAREAQRVASVLRQLPAPSAEARGSADCMPSKAATNAIRVDDPHGEPLELAFFDDCGWKYVALNLHGIAEVRMTKTLYEPMSVWQGARAVMPEDPTTVFVDGPTGYTFAWTRADGWNFIGRLRP